MIGRTLSGWSLYDIYWINAVAYCLKFRKEQVERPGESHVTLANGILKVDNVPCTWNDIQYMALTDVRIDDNGYVYHATNMWTTGGLLCSETPNTRMVHYAEAEADHFLSQIMVKHKSSEFESNDDEEDDE